jgi:sugar O-acyltransferase (sialic acid O-acetyltransferase NeuD family)
VRHLFVVGAGGHGAVVADAADESGHWDVISFLDDDESLDAVLDFPVAGTTETIFSHADGYAEFIVAIGDNRHRLELCGHMAEKGLRLATVVHPAACVSKSATISAGSVVCAGAVINARAEVGRACIVNTAATVDHDCILEDGVHVSPGANLAGTVRVRRRAWIGIGSSVREGVTIGCDSVIGAGLAVVNDVEDALTVGGVPAEVLTQR